MTDISRCCLAAVAFSLIDAAWAVDPTWIGASGNWSDTANWKGGTLPVAGDTVRVSNTVANITINIDAPSVTIKAIRFDGHTAAGDVTVTGGKLILTSTVYNMVAVTDKDGKITDYNTRHYDRSSCAIIAYPYGAIFKSPVEFTSTGSAGFMGTSRDLYFYNTVSAPNAKNFYVHNGIHLDQLGFVPDTTTHVYFFGDVSMPKANLTSYQSPTGHIRFLCPSLLELGSMVIGDYVSPTVTIGCTNTILNIGTLTPRYGARFESMVAGGYPTNTVVSFKKTSNPGTEGGTGNCVDLSLVDRTFDRLESDFLSAADNAGYLIRSYANNPFLSSYYGSAPTTLTLRGTKDAVTEAKIMDEITVVWDPVGNFTQTFSNRTHKTKGSFVVKGGTMQLKGAGSMAAARGLEIAAGATFELESSVADPLPRDLIVTSTSKLKLNGATVHVKRLIVDGVLKKDDTYTGEPWMVGAGSVVVSAGNCRTWIGGSGNWADTKNWAGGQVPNASTQTAILDAETAEDITVTIAADIAKANFPGQLEVVNRGAGTTTLRVAANVTDTNGLVRVARHARVEVPEGGTFFYETTDGRALNSVAWKTTHVLAVVDGGQWLTSGGEVVFTNLCGQCWVNGAGSKFDITGGRCTYTAWGSQYPFTIGVGGRLNLSGGTFSQPGEGYNQSTDLLLLGGTADFSGGAYVANTTCLGPGSDGPAKNHSIGTDLGHGTLILRDGITPSFSSTLHLRPVFANTHLDVIIRGNAGFWSEPMFGGRRYTTTSVILDGKPRRSANDSVRNGNWYLGGYNRNGTTACDAGNADLTVKSGSSFGLGYHGLFVAGGWARNQTPLYQKGYAHIEPNAALFIQGSTHSSYGSYFPTGILVGMGAWSIAGKILPSGRIFEGTAEIEGYVTNRVSLSVGGWYGRGVYVQKGGETLTGTDNTTLGHGATAVGFAGGAGSLLVSNGVFRSQQSVWVGGCFTNEYVVSGAVAGKAYPNLFVEKGGWPIDDHGAEGLLEVSGGDFTAAKSLYVGSDGTGVVSVVGSTGSFKVTQNLVLSNKTASVLRYTADAAGVKPITVGGKLVLTDASALEVDLSACPDLRRVKLVTATGGVVGDFAKTTFTPAGRQLLRRGNSIYAFDRRGVVITIR